MVSAAAQVTPLRENGERETLAQGSEKAPSLEEIVIPNGEIEKMIVKYFGKEARTAIAIAKAESGFDPSRVGDTHLAWGDGRNGMSCGLFQVRVFPNRPDCEKLKNPDNNIRFAYELYKKSGWSPWTVWKTNQYLKYL